MFLKQEEFTFNGQSLVIHELSALQRIELLEYLAREEKAQQPLSDDEPEEMQSARLVSFSIRAGARVVAMSLWQGSDKTTSVDQQQQQVLENWPVEAIGKADIRIKLLSGMIRPATDDEGKQPDVSGNQEEEVRTEPLQKP